MASNDNARGGARELTAHAGAGSAPPTTDADLLAMQLGHLNLAGTAPVEYHVQGELATFLPRVTLARIDVRGHLAAGGGYLYAKDQCSGACWFSPVGSALAHDPLQPRTRFVAALYHAAAPHQLIGQLYLAAPITTSVSTLRFPSGTAILECIYS